MSSAGDKARERAKRIIRELQNKTQENGCTEAEAMAAAAQIGELLAKYDMEIDEIGVREDTAKCEKNTLFAADDAAGSIIVGLKHFCSLIAYTDSTQHTRYVIFGTPHDLEIAKYMYEMLMEACDRGWSDFMETDGYSMKKRLSFRAGFANRVYSRLIKLKDERDFANRSTGTALIVLKNQLVTEEFRKQVGIKLVNYSRKGGAADPNAYYAGQDAGNRANLNAPITGGGRSSSDYLP